MQGYALDALGRAAVEPPSVERASEFVEHVSRSPIDAAPDSAWDATCA